MPATGRECATITAERLDDGIVVLSFLVPGRRQNVITERVVRDLAAALDALDAGPPPRGVVLCSGLQGSFFAGADIARLEALATKTAAEIERLCTAGRELFGRLSTCAWPTVAVIDGVCLGGGLELALACDFRVATTAAHTALGLPEVKLGLLPGWGGTVRLGRLIGPGPAIEFSAAGEPVDGATARRLGIVDACVPPEEALESARRLIEHHLARAGHHARRRRLAAPVVLDPAERGFVEAVVSAVILGRTGGHYPAPAAILRTLLAGSEADLATAGRLESAAFAALATGDVSRHLVRVFRLGERNRRDPGIGGADADAETAAVQPMPVEHPAIVGAGIMGAGIAASHLRHGARVTLVDVNAEALERSVAGILDEAAWDRATKRTDPAQALALAGRLRMATEVSALAGADLVIESVLERTDIKRQVLADIERAVAPDTVIATNTSTNPITKLATALAHPARFCGMHFFNPVRRMTLVEVVRGPATSDATIATAVAHAKRLGKCPIVVRDSPGFLVNRLLMPYLHEAVEMVREGIEPRRIDRVARAFGMPMGPLELYDMIGLDTAFYAGLVLDDAFGDRIEASPVIPALVKSGRLGRKTGAGFYVYDAAAGQRAKPARPDDAVPALVAAYALPARATSDRTIADRLLLPIVLEAALVLDEGLVRDGRDIDLAVIHALGFPAFRGGVLAWADSLGAAEIVRRLEPLADLGVRMQPAARLLDLARSGGGFTASAEASA
jgi:3-hydroxyacyl-CoA dehydrogenase/enoyl-CoA hydratase/carnithine racemase